MTFKTNRRVLLLAAGLLLTAATGGGAALAVAHRPVLVHADARNGAVHRGDDAIGCDPAPLPSPALSAA